MSALVLDSQKQVKCTSQLPLNEIKEKKRTKGVLAGRTVGATQNTTSVKAAKAATTATASSSTTTSSAAPISMNTVRAENTKATDEPTALEKHVLYFANNASQTSELIHPCDSKTYNPDVSINQTSLNAILNYAQPGKNFLSEIDVTTMVNDFRERDNERSSILDRNATDGEFKLLLRLCCDHWEEIDGKYVPCLTKETISLFYTDHNKLFKRVESGELPIAGPLA